MLYVKIPVGDLKKLCRLKGLTVVDLSNLTGISYIRLSRASNGKITLKNEEWEKIKKYIN